MWVRMARILQAKSAMASVITDKNWYAPYTRHQHEKTVASLPERTSRSFCLFMLRFADGRTEWRHCFSPYPLTRLVHSAVQEEESSTTLGSQEIVKLA